MYICKYCGQAFETRQKHNGHIARCLKVPDNITEFTCKFCNKVVIGKNSWVRHENHCKHNPNHVVHKTPFQNQDALRNEFVCQYCGKNCKNTNSLVNHERLCPKNVNRKIYNGINSYHEKLKTGEVTVWNKGLTKETDARVAAHSLKMHELYSSGEIKAGFEGRKHTQETKDKISAAHLKLDHDQFNKNSHGKRGWLDNMFFMSTWELAYYLFMRDKGHNIVRCPQKFDYVDSDNKPHTYTPDFLVDDKAIVEIKGYETDHDRFKYTLVPDLVVIGEKDIDPYLQYVYKTYETRQLETLYDKVPDVIS